MKKFVIICLEILRRLIDFDLKYQEALKDDASYQKVMGDLKEKNTILHQLVPKLEEDEKTKTKQKRQKRNSLIASCSPLCKLAIGYGKINSFLPFANLKGFSKSNLKRIADEELTNKISYLENLFTENASERDLAGITTEKLDKMKQELNAFILLIDEPQKNIESRKELHQEIDLNCKMVKKQINQGFADYMEGAYASKNKKLLQDFLMALDVNKASRRKLAITGSIIDASNQRPLSKVTLRIDNQEEMVRGGKKGKFVIKHLEAGEHCIRFQLPGYKSLEKKFIKYDGETHHMEVKLHSNLVEELVE